MSANRAQKVARRKERKQKELAATRQKLLEPIISTVIIEHQPEAMPVEDFIKAVDAMNDLGLEVIAIYDDEASQKQERKLIPNRRAPMTRQQFWKKLAGQGVTGFVEQEGVTGRNPAGRKESILVLGCQV